MKSEQGKYYVAIKYAHTVIELHVCAEDNYPHHPFIHPSYEHCTYLALLNVQGPST